MIEISLATQKNDFQCIEDLGKIIWKEHYTPIIGEKQVAYMLNKFQSVAAIENQISVGFEYFTIRFVNELVGYFSVLKKEDALFLSKIYILKESRGKGIGKKTMHFLETTAKHLGYQTLSLTVNKNNIETIKAYEKMGFKHKRDLVIDIGNGFVMDDYILEKEF